MCGCCGFDTKKLDCIDIGLIKLSVFAFALMLAKLYEPLLSLEWHWYAIIVALAAIKPLHKMFKK
jgi:hypothetical protein